MSSLSNRIRTIVGEDVPFFNGLGRLAFYFWASGFPFKLIQKKLFAREKKHLIAVKQIDYSALQLNAATPLISIIIPTKNKAALVAVCIESIIQKSTYKNFEILLVDNESSEDSLFQTVDKYTQLLKNSFSYIKADFPFNFSSLVNLGCQYAKGEYLVLLNNDTEVITPQWLEYLLQYASLPETGVVGCKLLYPDYTVQHAGINIFQNGIVEHAYIGVKRNDVLVSSVKNYPAITAAAFMVSKQKFLSVNGFDEAFKVEFNDIDFCLKLLNIGLNNIYLPHVELTHYESASRRHPLSSKSNYKRYKTEAEKMKQIISKYGFPSL